jgi:transposase
MRFVAVKSAERQATMGFKTRDLLVRQRTSLVNALRAHLAECEVVALTGRYQVGRLAALVEEAGALPEPVRRPCGELLSLITDFSSRIGVLDREVREQARSDAMARRLMTIPLRGLLALALAVLGPAPETFARRGSTARQDLEDGPAWSAAALDHRRERRGPLGATADIGRPPGA